MVSKRPVSDAKVGESPSCGLVICTCIVYRAVAIIDPASDAFNPRPIFSFTERLAKHWFGRFGPTSNE
jgi:hypothetical protein